LDTSSDEEEVPEAPASTATAPVAAPVPAAAAPAPAAAPEEPKESKEPKEPTPPKCKTCGAPCELRTARSAKNDGRRYWKFDAVSFDHRPRIDGVEA